jgi:PAS domain-containing protein
MFVKTTQFEILLDAVPDALVGMNQEGLIGSINPQTKSLFDYHRADLIGQPIETWVLDHGGA